EVRAAASRALDLPFVESVCRAQAAKGCALLWLGPDERLILADGERARELTSDLARAIGSLPHSLVDVSHRQIRLELGGAWSVDVLCAGCPLDLDASAFPVGMCTRTVLGKAEVLLWRTAVETFHIEVWRSFAAYVTRFLAEAARP